MAFKPLWKRRRVSERDEELLQDLARGVGRWFATHACSATMPRPRILVGGTDDAGGARIRAALGCAYDVVSAADGLQAIREADAHPPDLILLDDTIPRMNGHAACQALKADPRTARTPIIILTTKAEMAGLVRNAGHGSGADGYMVTPFDEEALRNKVAWVLRKGDES